jgi:TonB family protein
LSRTCPSILLLLFAVAGWAQEPASTSPPPGVQPPAKIGIGVKAPTLISKVEAEYSDEARRKHIEGICMVTLLVDAYGVPQNLRVVRCVDPSLEQSALSAVSQYRFNPAKRTDDGKAIPVQMTVEISYHLLDRPTHPDGFCEHWLKDGAVVRYSTLPPPAQGADKAQPISDGLYSLTDIMAPLRPTKISDEGFCKTVRAVNDDVRCMALIDLDAKGKVTKIESMQCSAAQVEGPLSSTLEKSQFTPGYLNGKKVPIRFALAVKYFVKRPNP